MPIVSNTSPVMNLAIIGELSALRNQFGEVWIPAAVLDELKIVTDLPGTDQINQALKDGWLSVMELDNYQLSQVLERDLDRGESHAIALALESNTVTI